MPQTLLIVEEALRDLKAHWFEYIKTIAQGAEQQGYQVEVACHRDATPDIQQQLNCYCVFRYARYLDNQTKKLPGERYYGFVLHSLRSLQVLWPLLNQRDRYSHILVPTVLVHHLLAWWIVMRFHPHRPQHLTLFFVANPGIWDSEKQASRLPHSPMTHIQRTLLRGFGPLIKTGTVTFGVETKGAQQEFEALTSLPFQKFPHPVPPLALPAPNDIAPPSASLSASLLFACYGFARYEKGSDLLKAAIEKIVTEQIVTRNNNSPNFCIQWVDSFALPDGSLCNASSLRRYVNVQLIDRPLSREEYQSMLVQTSCVLLPYRNSSYYARLSRLAIETVCLGIPIIYTQGGWLEEVVTEFGSGIGIQDGSVEALVNAIHQMQESYENFRQQSMSKCQFAQQYFSGETFCQQLLNNFEIS